MTVDQFLERLRQTPRDWYLTPKQRIRRGQPFERQCPLTACAKRKVTVIDYDLAAKQLGIKDADADDIVWAADGDTRHNAEIRKKILEACGL